MAPPTRAPRPPELTLCVVIPALDEERGIGELVGRLTQDGSDRAERVVVVDGGSRDRTAELATAAGAEVRTAERGRGTQLAAGARGASEDLLLFLHADCRLEPGSLDAVRAAFAEAGLGYAGLTQRVEAEGRFYRLVERAADRRVEAGMVYGDSGLVCRRELYERVGGFADLPLFEDVDLSRRLARAGRCARIAGAGVRISARRWRTEGALRTTLRNWMLRFAYRLGVPPRTLARLYAPHATHE